MKEPLEELYFNWLCAKVRTGTHPNYLDLLRRMFSTEFVWVVPGDENRIEDGLELRDNFIIEGYLDMDRHFYEEPVSVLEVLVALAYRAEFQTEISMQDWFWKFIENLGLDDYRTVEKQDFRRIEDILHRFVWRTYQPNGQGGIFPMMATEHDQRKVELWYQFCEYVDDQGLV